MNTFTEYIHTDKGVEVSTTIDFGYIVIHKLRLLEPKKKQKKTRLQRADLSNWLPIKS